ncbi:MAG TPA: GNAT family N-acetyltransferase [Bacillota bacterium]|nr:GNAT family N-acetyltransferase [Bacillota bacterium]
MTGNIDVRQLFTTEELAKTQEVERAVWNMEPIPLHQSFTAIKNGGISLGAFDGDKMVGYVYGFPGFSNGKVYLCSHMLGILPEYRGLQIGKMLKIEQANIARELGYSLMTWTFDPLESRNAHLNLNKLRARGAVYSPDHYGELTDDLNQGLPSDRLIIEWSLNEQPLEPISSIQKDYVLLDIDANGEPYMTETFQQDTLPLSNVFFVKIPLNFQDIKQDNFTLAKKWRLMTRKVFVHLFEKGYQATDVIFTNDRTWGYYALKQIDL